MELENKKSNDEILAKANKVVRMIVQENNWSGLTDLLITRAIRGKSGLIDMLIDSQFIDQENKETIAKIQDMLISEHIIIPKYTGVSYDVLEANGSVNGGGFSSCLSRMNCIPRVIPAGYREGTIFSREEFSFGSREAASGFAKAYIESHNKYLGYPAELRICQIAVVETHRTKDE